MTEKKVPVLHTRSFRKWGKDLELRIFDAAKVKSLLKKVPKWREQHKAALAKVRRKAAKKAAATRKSNVRTKALTSYKPPKVVYIKPDTIHAKRRREAFAELISDELRSEVSASHRPASYVFDAYEIRSWLSLEAPNIERVGSVTEGSETSSKTLQVELHIGVVEEKALAEAVLGTKSVKRQKDAARLACRTFTDVLQSLDLISQTWTNDLSQKVSILGPDVCREILDQIFTEGDNKDVVIRLKSSESAEELVSNILDALEIVIEKPLYDYLLKARTNAFRKESGYEKYPSLFPTARALDREIIFFCGPTNSGKTYQALSLAKEAASAEVLSPLRLLALEHYETMRDLGLPAGMVTGEEENVPQGTTHIARTIETMDSNRIVDVCIIDEIQMIADSSRGWAWTRALIGAPAKRVVLTGSADALGIVEKLSKLTGENLIVHHLERKTALHPLKTPVSFSNIKAGDAIIAFSRKDVHMLRSLVTNLGLEVACVYGGLGPEARRAEAARFASGEAPVLVATDAIGMGLNLPIRRVLFYDMEKFDGVLLRPLTNTEIRQIGGRAGRYGKSEEGFIGSIGLYHGPEMITKALNNYAIPLFLPVPVAPDFDAVVSASEVIKSNSLKDILLFLDRNLISKKSMFTFVDTQEMMASIAQIDDLSLDLRTRWSYALSPFDKTNRFMLREIASEHALFGRVVFDEALLERFENHIVLSPYGNPIDFSYCEMLERRSRFISAWLWLARRFPDVYQGIDFAYTCRDETSREIETFLRQTSHDHAKSALKRIEEGKLRKQARKSAKAEKKPDASSGSLVNVEAQATEQQRKKRERNRLKRKRRRERRRQQKQQGSDLISLYST